jgi:hypothetical protein
VTIVRTIGRCIGEPISWLRLETHSMKRDESIAKHLAECAACAACFAEITGDLVALPPLAVPEKRAGWNWRRWFVPAMAAAAAAIVLIVIVRRDPEVDTTRPDHVAGIKGAGDVILGLVRDRAGTIRNDVTTFAPGDRFKVTLTCAPGPSLWVDVGVVDSQGVDYPLGVPQQIACGNQVVLRGAFSITGRESNRVCARLDTAIAPSRAQKAPAPRDPGVACITLRPE